MTPSKRIIWAMVAAGYLFHCATAFSATSAGQPQPITIRAALAGAADLLSEREATAAQNLLHGVVVLHRHGAPRSDSAYDLAFTLGLLGGSHVWATPFSDIAKLAAILRSLVHALESGTRLDIDSWPAGQASAQLICDALFVRSYFTPFAVRDVLVASQVDLTAAKLVASPLLGCLLHDVVPNIDWPVGMTTIIQQWLATAPMNVMSMVLRRKILEGQFGDAVAATAIIKDPKARTDITRAIISARQLAALKLPDADRLQSLLINWEAAPDAARDIFGFLFLMQAPTEVLGAHRDRIDLMLHQATDRKLADLAMLVRLHRGGIHAAQPTSGRIGASLPARLFLGALERMPADDKMKLLSDALGRSALTPAAQCLALAFVMPETVKRGGRDAAAALTTRVIRSLGTGNQSPDVWIASSALLAIQQLNATAR